MEIFEKRNNRFVKKPRQAIVRYPVSENMKILETVCVLLKIQTLHLMLGHPSYVEFCSLSDS